MKIFLDIVINILLLTTILGVGYLLLIMPRPSSHKLTAPFRKWLYAHRGLHDNQKDCPENSMRAFENAVEKNYGIELDVQLTKDRIPVVFHDDTLNRICGIESKVQDFTYEELKKFRLCNTQERIPKFEEVLDLINGRVPLIVELKVNGVNLSLCREVDKLMQRYHGMYCVESFNPLAVCWYRRKRREIVRGQLSNAFIKEGEGKGILFFILQNLLLNCLGKPDFIAYNHKYPRMLSRKICHRIYHNTAAAWTIKSEEELAIARKYFDVFIFDSFEPLKAS